MKGKTILAIATAAWALAVLARPSRRKSLTVPGGLAFSEFRGIRRLGGCRRSPHRRPGQSGASAIP